MSSTVYVPQIETQTGEICRDCGAYYKNETLECPLCVHIEQGTVCMHCGESLGENQEIFCDICYKFITGFDEEISNEELAMLDREFAKMNKKH